MFSRKKDILVIVGPTASGKSQLSIEIAKKYNAEIISADAYQVYRGMDIGTAKINKKDQEGIKHHLIDIKDIHQSYSAAEFTNLTKKIIDQCRKNHKPIIICGGTALYLYGFLYDYQFTNQLTCDKKRKKLDEMYPNNQDLWNHLYRLDPNAANTIHENNRVRVLRALQVTLDTQKPFSEQKIHADLRTDVKLLGIEIDRSKLYENINKRVDNMIQQGLEQEVYRLVENGYNLNYQSAKAIGYKEILNYFAKKISKDDMINLIKRNTRRFAKRQLTWFKKFEKIEWMKIAT